MALRKTSLFALADKSAKLKELVEKAKKLPPINVAIICPDSIEAVEGAILAAEENSINPIFIGEINNIQKFASELGVNINKYQCLDYPAEIAILHAVKMARTGEVQALMKGSIHTDELMQEIVKKDNGLRTATRMSHCMLTDLPAYKKLFILTDAGLNINPTLQDKIDIVQNAINFAIALDIEHPKVALISAVETVTERIPNTIEYAAICKMAERGQIRGGIIDGPLAFDLAVSERAIKAKKLTSQVAGDFDVLVVPNLEVGNILTKTLDNFANAISLGIIIGAKIPIILTSRSADALSRAGSCMLAKFYSNHILS